MAGSCAREPFESVVLGHAYLITDSFDLQSEHIHVFVPLLPSAQSSAYVKGRTSRDVVLIKPRINGVSLNGEASCPLMVFGAYLVTDSFHSQFENIHVFYLIAAVGLCYRLRRDSGNSRLCIHESEDSGAALQWGSVVSGTLFESYLITKSFNSRTKHNHMFDCCV